MPHALWYMLQVGPSAAMVQAASCSLLQGPTHLDHPPPDNAAASLLLLSPDEQRLAAQLSIVKPYARLSAAAAVTVADLFCQPQQLLNTLLTQRISF
jgi:hypothetical protein